jgi:MFS family permease
MFTDSVKETFLSSLAVFEFGSLICAVATSSDMLIVGRAIGGMGGSGLLIGLLTLLASSSPLQKRPGTLTYIL